MTRTVIFSISICTLFVSAVMAQTLTPTPAVHKLADFNSDFFVDDDDLLAFFNLWMTVSPVGVVSRGNVNGELGIGDECGVCVVVPEDAWVILEDGSRRFLSKVNPNGTYQFEGIPTGTYQLTAWDRKGTSCPTQFSPVIITEGNTTVPKICLAQKPAPDCSEGCIIGSWAIIFACPEFTGGGVLSFNSDGTVIGPLTFEEGDTPNRESQVLFDGTYTVHDNCGLTFQGTLSPRAGGDCQTTGTLSVTEEGIIHSACTEVDGYWNSNLSINCSGDDLSGPYAGGFSMMKDVKKHSTLLNYPKTANLGISMLSEMKNNTGSKDLNDDGSIDAIDLLFLLAQWHLRIPDTPLCTPLPTCTATETNNGGNNTPEPTPTFDPNSLAGWWEIDWSFTDPISANFSTQNNLGDPGQVQSFDLGNSFENVTASYQLGESGQFVLTISGTSAIPGVPGTFTMTASGVLNPEHTRINDGVITGKITGPFGQERNMAGTFVGYKCCVVGMDLDCTCHRP